MIRVHVADDVIEATPGHPFWVCYGDDLQSRPIGEHQTLGQIPSEGTTPGRWVDSHDLQVGDVVLLQDRGFEPITAIEVANHTGPVINFRVAELQCYAVGECLALVHNSCDIDMHQSTPKAIQRRLAKEGNPIAISRNIIGRPGLPNRIDVERPLHRAIHVGSYTGAGRRVPGIGGGHYNNAFHRMTWSRGGYMKVTEQGILDIRDFLVRWFSL